MIQVNIARVTGMTARIIHEDNAKSLAQSFCQGVIAARMTFFHLGLCQCWLRHLNYLPILLGSCRGSIVVANLAILAAVKHLEYVRLRTTTRASN